MAARLITGDECGLLKECLLPSWTTTSTVASTLTPMPTPQTATTQTISTHDGIRRLIPPSSSNSNSCRRRGVVALTWLVSSKQLRRPWHHDHDNNSCMGNNGDSEQPQQQQQQQSSEHDDQAFAALLMDGTVQIWSRNDSNSNRNHPDIDKNSSHAIKDMAFGNYQWQREYPNLFFQETGDRDDEHQSKALDKVIPHSNSNSKDDLDDDANNRTPVKLPPLDPATRPIAMMPLCHPLETEASYSSSSNDIWCLLCICNGQGQAVVLDPNNNAANNNNNAAGAILARWHVYGPQAKHLPCVAEHRGMVVSAMTVHPVTGWLAAGGKDRETVVWDLYSILSSSSSSSTNASQAPQQKQQQQQPLWKAKNLPPDPQTLLQHPIWPTAMTFFHAPPVESLLSDETLSSSDVLPRRDRIMLAVGTAYGQVRIYDLTGLDTLPQQEAVGKHHQQGKIQRRPIFYTKRPKQQTASEQDALQHRITALQVLIPGKSQQQQKQQQLLIGDAAGYLHAMDLQRTAVIGS